MNEPKATPIGDGVRAAIRESDQSVYKIAQVVGCSPQQLYNFLSGKRGLSLEILDGLAVALDLEVSYRKRTSQADGYDQPREPSPHPAPVTLADALTAPILETHSASEYPGEPLTIPSAEPAISSDVDTQIDLRCAEPKDLFSARESAGPTPCDPRRRPKLGRRGPIPPFVRPGAKEGPGDPRVRQAFGAGRKAGVIPNELSAADPSDPIRYYRPDSAADAEPEHFNVGRADHSKMLGLWGLDVEAFYRNQKRDTSAKKNIYDFLSVLCRNDRTRKYFDYMKKFPMPEVLNWVQAFPPRDQQEIASQLPFLDDGLFDEDPSVNKSFWDRVDKDSFYKAVEKSFGGRIKPDPHLIAKYVNGKTRNSVRRPSDESDCPIRK